MSVRHANSASLDASSTIPTLEKALAQLQATLKTHAFNFRTFALKAQVSDDGTSSSSSNRLRNSDGVVLLDADISLSAVAAELIALLELYPMLRFQYGELMAKLNYIEAILDVENLQYDLPLSAHGAELAVEMEILGERKAYLRDIKLATGKLLEEIEGVSQRVAGGWVRIEKDVAELRRISGELPGLEGAIAKEVARLGQEGDAGDGLHLLSLSELRDLLWEVGLEGTTRSIEVGHLNKHVIPRARRRIETLDGELESLEQDHKELVEAMRRDEVELDVGKSEVGRDQRDVDGKWSKAVIRAMGRMFQ